MSYAEVETYEIYNDPILELARDPALNKEKGKTSKLLLLILGFPVAERKVSRLCNLSLGILQALEKIELNLKNWAFMSLDINSANHFDTSNSDEIKIFNNNVSLRVVTSCQELTVKLNKITADIDFITSALRSLSPLEYISDSGTLLTTLTLRAIKLKDELRDKVTIAYLKAKLITIGTDLETMLDDGSADQRTTVASYKQFVVSLLNQLNKAVEDDDTEDRNECLAVISDMEQMFDVFKLERLQQKQPPAPEPTPAAAPAQQPQLALDVPYLLSPPKFDSSDDYESSDDASTSQSMSLYTQPMVHSITKHNGTKSPELSYVAKRRGSLSSFTSSSILHKSTISEELPYLMSAFNLAKTIEEDVHHFKQDEQTPAKTVQQPTTPVPSAVKQFLPHKTHLPSKLLYSESQFIQKPFSTPGAYIYANDSLLSKLGIKPQVVTAEIPRQLSDSAYANRSLPDQNSSPGSPSYGYGSNLLNGKKDDKENVKERIPLTKENLATHNLSSLALTDTLQADFVE